MKQIEGEPDPLSMVIDLGEEKGKKEITFIQPETKQTNAIQEELKSFLEAVKENSEIKVSLEDGHTALNVAYQILDKMMLTTTQL